MVVKEHRKVAGEAWEWVRIHVLRPLKVFFLWFGGFGAIGNMGRDLIEGIDLWVDLVSLYRRIFAPVADILAALLQAPITLIAALFDISLTLPEFPIWGVDIIVLANIAAGFLVFKKFLTIPAQFFVSLTIVISLCELIYSISLYTDHFLMLALLLAVTGAYFVYVALRTQVYSIAVAVIAVYDSGRGKDDYTDRNMYGSVSNLVDLVIQMIWIAFFQPREIGNVHRREQNKRFDQEPSIRRVSGYKVMLTYGVIFVLGAMVAILNTYADVYLPPLERLAHAWDMLVREWFLGPLGLD